MKIAKKYHPIDSGEHRMIFRQCPPDNFRTHESMRRGQQMPNAPERKRFEARHQQLDMRKEGLIRRMDAIAKNKDSVAWQKYKQKFLSDYEYWNKKFDQISQGHHATFQHQLESVIRGYEQRIQEREQNPNPVQKNLDSIPSGGLEQINANTWALTTTTGDRVGFKFDTYNSWQYLQPNTVSIGDMRANGFRVLRDQKDRNRILIRSNLKFDYAINNTIVGSSDRVASQKLIQENQQPDTSKDSSAESSNDESSKSAEKLDVEKGSTKENNTNPPQNQNVPEKKNEKDSSNGDASHETVAENQDEDGKMMRRYEAERYARTIVSEAMLPKVKNLDLFEYMKWREDITEGLKAYENEPTNFQKLPARERQAHIEEFMDYFYEHQFPQADSKKTNYLKELWKINGDRFNIHVKAMENDGDMLTESDVFGRDFEKIAEFAKDVGMQSDKNSVSGLQRYEIQYSSPDRHFSLVISNVTGDPIVTKYYRTLAEVKNAIRESEYVTALNADKAKQIISAQQK